MQRLLRQPNIRDYFEKFTKSICIYIIISNIQSFVFIHMHTKNKRFYILSEEAIGFTMTFR